MSTLGNATNLVYPLADAFQLRLGVYFPKGAKHEQIKGLPQPLKAIPIHPLLALKVPCEVKASYKSATLTAILIKVRKDLFAYLTYKDATETLALYLIDAGEIPMTPVTLGKVDNTHPTDVLSMLKPAVVAIFNRGVHDTEWKQKALPQ